MFMPWWILSGFNVHQGVWFKIISIGFELLTHIITLALHCFAKRRVDIDASADAGTYGDNK